MRVRAAWSLMLPLLVVGELGGHWLAYRLAASDGQTRAELLVRTGHGGRYLAVLPVLAGTCLLLAALVLVRIAARGTTRRVPPVWALAAAPAVAFVVQEYAERLVHTGRIDWTTPAERAVLIGIALQIPGGVLCVLLVRALTRLAESVAAALARVGAPRGRRLAAAERWAVRILAVPGVPALGHASDRAPPHFG